MKNHDQANGKLKQAIGNVIDDDELRQEGRVDESVGNVKGRIDEAKDKIDQLVDTARDQLTERR